MRKFLKYQLDVPSINSEDKNRTVVKIAPLVRMNFNHTKVLKKTLLTSF